MPLNATSTLKQFLRRQALYSLYKFFYLSYWFRLVTKLPVILKGILTAEDARLAVQHGVDGIIVSCHGGRQLDTVPATVRIFELRDMTMDLFNCTDDF